MIKFFQWAEDNETVIWFYLIFGVITVVAPQGLFLWASLLAIVLNLTGRMCQPVPGRHYDME